MLELTEAEKANIRQWAWNETRGFGRQEKADDGKESFKQNTFVQHIGTADRLAAWVMSGTLGTNNA